MYAAQPHRGMQLLEHGRGGRRARRHGVSRPHPTHAQAVAAAAAAPAPNTAADTAAARAAAAGAGNSMGGGAGALGLHSWWLSACGERG